jgi:hypothetical protein
VPVLTEPFRLGFQIGGPQMRAYKNKVRTYALLGTAVGGLYAVIGTVVYVLRGGSLGPGIDLSWFEMVVLYLGGGFLAGLLGGALSPLATNLVGRALVSLVVSYPLAVLGLMMLVEVGTVGKLLRMSLFAACTAGLAIGLAVSSTAPDR